MNTLPEATDTIYNEWVAAFTKQLNLQIPDPNNADMELVVGIEEVSLDMPKFTGYVTGFMDKIAKVFDNLSLIPIPFIRNDFDLAVIRVKRTTRANLERFTVVCPEYLDGDMVGYLHTLTDVLTELLNIDKQLLQPIEYWCEKMLNDKRYVDQPWMSLPPLNNQVEIHQTVLKAYFNKSVGKGVDNKPFSQMYNGEQEFKEYSMVIETLNKLALKALDGKLNKRAAAISSLIDRIGKNDRLKQAMSQLPEGKIATVSALTFECAKQMEMLAIVLYQIRVVGSSFKETIEKINNQL